MTMCWLFAQVKDSRALLTSEDCVLAEDLAKANPEVAVISYDYPPNNLCSHMMTLCCR